MAGRRAELGGERRELSVFIVNQARNRAYNCESIREFNLRPYLRGERDNPNKLWAILCNFSGPGWACLAQYSTEAEADAAYEELLLTIMENRSFEMPPDVKQEEA
nr:MAG TPA: hypothetical protein [Caudoviricetes sp.]